MARRGGPRGRRLRRAWGLVGRFTGDHLVLRNFVQRTGMVCSAPTVALLERTEDAITPWAALWRLRQAGDPEPRDTLRQLLATHILLTEGTPEAGRDQDLQRSWRWGTVAAAFHHGLRDVRFLGIDQAPWLLGQRARLSPPPVRDASLHPGAVRLPAPRLRGGVLPHLLRRRSTRELAPAPLTSREISEVLFAGLGVRGTIDHPVQGRLERRLAPSGGALGAIDAYLQARRIRGLAPGVYRYSGLQRILEPIRRGQGPSPRLLLGGQEWTAGAAAVVYLVARFGRTSWKYPHPIAYRVVLLEAGHVAQNLLLAACNLGLAATPTCAFADSRLEALLRLDGADDAPVHAVVLGRPLA